MPFGFIYKVKGQAVKNFSAEYVTNRKILEKARLGFEFEFYSKCEYPKLLEMLNTEFAPIRVHGFSRYHTKFSLSESDFKIEPDNSGGDDMVEFVTHHLPYHEAKIVLLRALKFLQKWAVTNELCAFQMNLSFDPNLSEKQISGLNLLKFILNFDEDKVYRMFPNRVDNIYAKSIKRIIPYRQFDYVQSGVNNLSNGFMLPGTKYFGINFSKLGQHNYLEYRYTGGKDYQFKTAEITELMDEFIVFTHSCIDEPLAERDVDMLRSYLQDRIESFRSFCDLDKFLTAFKDVELLVDRSRNYDVLKSYYPRFSEQLYDLLSNSKDMVGATINWDTDRNRLELVGASARIVFPIRGVDMIDCKIRSGEMHDIFAVNCTFEDVHLYESKLNDTKVRRGKLMDTDVNAGCDVVASFYNGGSFDGRMWSGVFRKGRLGKNAKFSSSVKFIDPKRGYFRPVTATPMTPVPPSTNKKTK